MNDVFDLPPERELPAQTRLAVRNRIMAELRAPERPRSALLVPLSMAAAVVALAAVTAGLIASGHGRPANTAHPPVTRPAASTAQPPPGAESAVYIPPAQLYSATFGKVRHELTSRCAAQDNGDRPAAATWQPIASATANGVDLIAYHTPVGPLFCEVTPTTVTLSQVATGSGTKVTFTTQFGSAAGVVDPKYRWLDLNPGGPDGKGGGTALLRDGVFLIPNGIQVRPGPATFRVFLTPQPRDYASMFATQLPAVTPPVTDAPAPPADQGSPSAHLLDQCVTQGTDVPVINPAGWEPGVTLSLDSHETLQLGTQLGLLATCVLNSEPTAAERATEMTITNGTGTGNARVLGAVAANPYVISSQLFYDFDKGTDASQTTAIVGLVESDRVTRVTLTQPGLPSITGIVHNGTFVVPGVDVHQYHQRSERLVLSDAAGKVIATLPFG